MVSKKQKRSSSCSLRLRPIKSSSYSGYICMILPMLREETTSDWFKKPRTYRKSGFFSLYYSLFLASGLLGLFAGLRLDAGVVSFEFHLAASSSSNTSGSTFLFLTASEIVSSSFIVLLLFHAPTPSRALGYWSIAVSNGTSITLILLRTSE